MGQNQVILRHKNSLSHEGGSEQSERASERVSAAEGASEVSSAEQSNEWAVRANKQTDDQVAQYYSLYSWLLSTIVTWLIVNNGTSTWSNQKGFLSKTNYFSREMKQFETLTVNDYTDDLDLGKLTAKVVTLPI